MTTKNPNPVPGKPLTFSWLPKSWIACLKKAQSNRQKVASDPQTLTTSVLPHLNFKWTK